MVNDELYSPDLDRLASLVDHRTEEPDIEYKSWMNLSDPEYKSKLAKHLCALTNYGGGWIVFGIDDYGSHAEPHPGDLKGYSQDIINGIVSRYLTPSFHCNVYFINSPLTSKKYPVVRVPPHGAQPVCAKTDGPLINKQRLGVTQGVHYIRTSGPQSVAIDRPELWKEVLHRCVLAERSQLLSSIGRLFEQPTIIPEAPLLDKFVDEGIERWSQLQKPGWPVNSVENKSTVSFQLLTDSGRPVLSISLKLLLNSLRDASNAADAERQFTSPPFDMSYSGMSSPSVILFGDVEGYESDTIIQDGTYLFAPSLSRVLVNGVGAEVRPYHEDTDWVRNVAKERTSREWPLGERLSPTFQASRMYAFVLFVRRFAASFSDAARCIFVVDFDGLQNRMIAETRGFNFRGEKRALTSKRRFRLEIALEKLTEDGASEIAASLLNPMLRLFSGTEVDAAFVRHKGAE
jgi:hypothetical protein